MSVSINTPADYPSLIETRRSKYKFAELSAAGSRVGGVTRLIRGVLRFRNVEPPNREISLDYDQLVLVRRTLPAEEAFQLIGECQKSETTVPSLGLTVPKSMFDMASWAWNESRGLPNPIGTPRFSDWPSRSFLLVRSDRTIVPPPQGPIANTRLPIVSDPNVTIDEFIELPISRYYAVTGLAVLLPDFRARFKRVKVGDRSISMEFEAGELPVEDLMLRAVIDNRDPAEPLVVDSSRKSATLPVSSVERSVEVFLLDRSMDDVVDWIQLRQGATESYPEVEFETPGAQIQRLVRLGEGGSQEFKQELAGGDRLAETIVAFANTRGGTIFLGIDDLGRPHQVDQKTTAESVERVIRSQCDPYIRVDFENTVMEEVPILLVKVPEGSSKPYVFRKRGTVHIRGGRTNFLATSEEIRFLATPKQ